MAILEKRRAVNQLPRFQRYSDTRAGDRAAALRGETPITSAVRELAGTSGYGPMGRDTGFMPMGGAPAGGAKIDKFGNVAGQPKTAVTSALKGSTGAAKPAGVTGKTLTSTAAGAKTTGKAAGVTAAGTTSKTPGLTSKTPGATSLTSKGTGTAKPATTATTGKTLTSTGTGTAAKTAGTTTGAGAKTTGGSKSGSLLTNALAGAALGAGTKFVIDKLTGTSKTPGGSGGAGGSGTPKGGAGGAGGGTGGGSGVTSVVKGAGAGGTNVGTPPFVPGGARAGAGTVGPKAPVTSGPKAPVSGGSKTPAGPKTPAGGGTKGAGAGAAGSGVGQGDQTEGTEDKDTTGDTGATVIAYDDEGNLLPGYELDENNNPVWVGIDNQDTAVAGEGEDTVVAGSGGEDLVVDENGTPTRGLGTTTGYTETDTDGLFSDDDGNLYDADGNLVQYADGTMVGDEDTTDVSDVAYTDEYGNEYDAGGNLLFEADHSDYVFTDENGNQYNWDGELISEGDHSDFTQTDAEGNVYDWDGNLIAYADGTSPDDYTEEEEPPEDYTEEPPEERKGGLIHMADGGEPISEKQNDDGTIVQMFDDGSSITYNQEGQVIDVSEPKSFDAGGGAYSDTTEEVQPWQNTDYLYNETGDEPLLTGSNSLYRNAPLVRQTALFTGSDSPETEGWPAGFVSNGDGTATYVGEDGSTVTIDADSNIVYVTDANGDVVAQDGQPTGGLSQVSGGNRVYYDDGSSVETFDDGSQIVYNSDGSVYNTMDAYQTTYDDEGNAIVTDGYGNIVSVYDPQGNVIPLGGGRVTGPTQVTGAGGSGGERLTTGQTPAQRREEATTNAASESAIKDLLSGLNTYGGAGIAGAVLGSLLGNTDLFGGGGGGGGGGIDMSKVGVIDPRTTDYGIGPARFVGYDEYGTPEQMPELYGTELYQNLNAPGFNEVNPGDYARYDEAEFGPNEEYVSEDMVDEEGQPMAEGGAPMAAPQGGLGMSMPQTYYTFGKPVDPIQNLRNPTPFQAKQQGMPQQAAYNATQVPPQTAMPQAGATPNQPTIPQGTPPAGVGMKGGGLPALSNVPITNGRLNFRHGAPVHGPGDGQSDDIPAMLADGEYVIDAETVAQIGNGSTKAGAKALDKFRENIRAHKRSAPVNKIPPKTKALTSYLKGAK